MVCQKLLLYSGTRSSEQIVYLSRSGQGEIRRGFR
jgi:hypothetical protein